ncbi:MAG: isoprenylcysteine carboxylmethyltransferase family protein [Micavibrio aeruginosavorus]|uniref:Isoprenylcysteine carboxylmethyltransferase family protein n=1 Tax=Micavibrio aeruginosavorus TaxID=349221 RepID=A0A7T5R1G5_9BACT|nr:MAG: isoprenylcysteine carboxylmethyltransferase family protein [Micavibrio aeruginosavorus]
MEHADMPAYGLWSLVMLNSLLFIFFAFSFFKPQTKTDWRSFGAFSAFIIALFVEMYGFPLTIYLFSGWLTTKYPGVNFLSHENGHLIHTLLGMKGDAHWDVFHIFSNLFIFGGFVVLAYAWSILWKAQREHKLATAGIYAHMRHPQYAAFIFIMLGFLLQWPTLPTLIMFPVLTIMYVRLALTEEKIAEKEFADEWRHYVAMTPRFIPRFSAPETRQKRG